MRNDIIIFRGPSIPILECKEYLDAIYLPPAMQGDMYRSYLEYKPKAIGLIDGNFECIPSPWHKEILYLMSQGVKIFGASSMGALRAAELDALGMIGLGEIYNAYTNNIIEDDDEVAILHAPKELDYHPLSDAMVDIRLTIEHARHNNIISKKVFDILINFYKNLFYKHRTYQIGLDRYREIYPEEITQLEKWLETCKIQQKKLDAILLLKTIQCYEAFSKYNFNFQNTVYWHNLKFMIDNNIKKSA